MSHPTFLTVNMLSQATSGFHFAGLLFFFHFGILVLLFVFFPFGYEVPLGDLSFYSEQ
uniref:Uncharacterized protein n=1 Tax=Rhizophora mucronata TaxID=61149 RepID=A0A2P2MGR9_RHIMU